MGESFDATALADGTREAIAFLSAFHSDREVHCVAIAPNGAVKAKSASPAELNDLAAWIASQQGRSNIYFAVNGPRPGLRNRKAKKDDIVEAYALHVDIDHLDGLERLRRFPIPPTAIVASGGGFQPFWMLAEPSSDLGLVERLNLGLAKRLGGDKCHNVDRIMRVPGTINLPNAKKQAAGRVPVQARLVEADWTRTYSPEEFSEFLGADDPGSASATASAVTEDQVVPVSLAQLPASIPAYARALVEHGDDPERPRGSADARFPSRSEAVYSLACALAKAGCTADVIAGVLINPEHAISVSILEKKRPRAYALKQARAAIQEVGDGWPDMDKAGNPRPTWRNVMLACRRLGLRAAYDQFRQQKTLHGKLLEDHQGEISDDIVLVVRRSILENYGFDPRNDNVRDAIAALCLENSFHAIRDMLESLTWDGVPRLDRWMTAYLGAPDTPLNAAIGSILLIAAVRRIRRPGVKFDQIVVLEGAQGSGKSTSIKILAGEGNHSDQEILALDAKQQMELLAGVWFYELSEIVGMSKAEVGKIKAFASREADKARLSYGYFAVTRLRQAVLIGTTNEDRYLRDQTGNRRFWPVKTGFIDLNALQRDRDQLLAEAAVREARGESIQLPEALWEEAAREQNERLEEDPWSAFLEGLNGKAAGDEARLYTDDLLERLGVPRERQHQGHTKRLAALMHVLGWKRDKFKVGGKTIRGFSRPKRPDHVDDEPRPSF